MANNFHHIPVLLDEVIESLSVKKGKKYIDATLGGGGHTSEILKRGGIVLGIDQDEDAIQFVKEKYNDAISDGTLKVVKGNFSNIAEIAVANGFGNVDGILLDLGVSSYQLDASGRGFSLRHDEELDMRMDKDGELTASEVINKYSYEKLVDIFYRYGEEHNARKIAEAIVEKRKKSPIHSTKELAELVLKVPHKSESIHPATRIFQALRIEVNQELNVLREAIEKCMDLLAEKGVIGVISFHSLEDRIVKQAFDSFTRWGMGIALKKPLVATQHEQLQNRRSRSAKLRIFSKN